MKWLVALALVPALAHADEPAPPDDVVGNETIEVTSGAPFSGATTTSAEIIVEKRDEESVSKGWFALPHGQTVGAELRFITSPQPYGGASLAFTDVALLTLRGRTALPWRSDLFFAIDLLPKQPSTTTSRVFQGATLGLDHQLWKSGAAFVRTSGGTLIDDRGTWGQVAIGVDARARLDEFLTFEGGVSGLATQLFADPASAWLGEAALSGSMLFRAPEGLAGAWLGFGYSYPIAHDGGMLDPQPRLDVGIGIVLSWLDHWDVFARYAVVDRGDVGAMATQLPILDGGFDQRQTIVGVTYRTR